MENSKIEQAVIKQGEQQYFQKDENTFREGWKVREGQPVAERCWIH